MSALADAIAENTATVLQLCADIRRRPAVSLAGRALFLPGHAGVLLSRPLPPWSAGVATLG